MKSNTVYIALVILTIACQTSANSRQHVKNATSEEEADSRSAPERQEKLQTAGLAFGNALAAILGVTNPLVGATVAIGVAVMEPILDAINGEPDVWDQIESRLNIRIGEKLAANRLHNLKTDVIFPIDRRIRKGKRFDSADLESILDKMESVIPTNPTLGWNYDLPLMMVTYLPYLIAGYHKVISDKNDYPPCALPNTLNLFRARVILGLKVMMRKRYKAIHSDTWDKTERNCNQKNIIKTRDATRPITCTEFHMIYTDTVTEKKLIGKRWKGAPVRSWDAIISSSVRNAAADYLFKEVAEKINKFFTDDICLKQFSCKCPEPIRKEEFNVGWPNTCYGKKDVCVFPAAIFNWSEGANWCYHHGDDRETSWVYADAVDLEECMPFNTEPVEPLNNLNGFR